MKWSVRKEPVSLALGKKKKKLHILEENANAKTTLSLNYVSRPMWFLQHLHRLSVLGWNNDNRHINNDIRCHKGGALDIISFINHNKPAM